MRFSPPVVKLKVLAFIDQAPDLCIRDRIKKAADITFTDDETGEKFKFTWRTISTWLYRYKKHGTAALIQKKRKDKGTYRKITPEQLAEFIDIAIKHLPKSTSQRAIKTVIYNYLLEKQYFARAQLAPTTFYRFIREKELLKPESCQKLRLTFCMPFANDMWQGDTLFGPTIPGPNGKPANTYLIALIDDCSKLLVHAAFYHSEKIYDLTHAIKLAIYSRGIPNMLYFDNGSIYKSKTIIDACIRLNIKLSHTPVRDGSAKGKIERLNENIRYSFFKRHGDFKNLAHLNSLFKEWVNDYNNKIHSSIQMTPENRFAIDLKRIRFLENSEFNDEIFFSESLRSVSNTNTFSLHNIIYECPVDLRDKKIEVRFDPFKPETVITYYNQRRYGKAKPLNPNINALLKREFRKKPEDKNNQNIKGNDLNSNNQTGENKND